jgi:ubiquinone biosynthesis protein
MVGHLDEDLREHLGTSLLALVRRDVGMILDVYLEIGYVSDDTDLAGLRREMLGLLDRYYGIPVKHVDLQQAFGDCMRIAREHHVPLPRDFVLLGKAFVTIMGYACALDPDFDIARVVRPYALRLLRRKLSPARLGRMGLSQAWQWNNLLRRAPSGLRQFGRKLLDGDMRMKVSIEGLEPVGEELDRATNRVALSVILGSVVIGSSLTLHARIPPFVSDVPGLRFLADWVPELSVIGLVGFVVAGALGMLVAWGIWKHGKL